MSRFDRVEQFIFVVVWRYRNALSDPNYIIAGTLQGRDTNAGQ